MRNVLALGLSVAGYGPMIKDKACHKTKGKLLMRQVTLEKKRGQVDALLKQLALDACQNVRIGSAMQRGISGAPCPWQAFKRLLLHAT